MTALGKFPRGTGAPTVPLLIPAAACGGGGGGPRFSGIDANPILASDARLRLADGRQVRVPDVSCTPSGSRELTVDGETVPFQVGDDGSGAAGTATVYGTRGDRNDFGAMVAHERDDGFTARYAAAGGVAHPDSPPLAGSASWRGDTVGLDGDSRVVRRGAEITVASLTDPLADVALTPRYRPRAARSLKRVSLSLLSPPCFAGVGTRTAIPPTPRSSSRRTRRSRGCPSARPGTSRARAWGP